MILDHVNSPYKRDVQSLKRIEGESSSWDPDRIQDISMRICNVNLRELSIAKLEARRICRKNTHGCVALVKLFNWLHVDSLFPQHVVWQRYLALEQDIGVLVQKNRKALESRFGYLITNQDEIEDPIEMAILFVYGCEKEHKTTILANYLQVAYREIEELAKVNEYSLRWLRVIANASRKVFCRHERDVRVRVGSAIYTFHDLLLEHQSGYFRGQTGETRDFHLQDCHSRAFKVIYNFIENGVEPDFTGLGQSGAKKFIEICRRLQLSEELVARANEWLEE